MGETSNYKTVSYCIVAIYNHIEIIFTNFKVDVITAVVCIIVPLQNEAFSHHCFLFPVILPQKERKKENLRC